MPRPGSVSQGGPSSTPAAQRPARRSQSAVLTQEKPRSAAVRVGGKRRFTRARWHLAFQPQQRWSFLWLVIVSDPKNTFLSRFLNM